MCPVMLDHLGSGLPTEGNAVAFTPWQVGLQYAAM